MSGIPAEIAELGATGQRLSQNPGFDPMRAGLSTEEYFVWSRFDGATSLRDLLLMTGFPSERAIAIVQRLRALGGILLPGENPATMAGKAKPAGTAPAPMPQPQAQARPGGAPNPAPRPSTGPIIPPRTITPVGTPSGSIGTAPTQRPKAPSAPPPAGRPATGPIGARPAPAKASAPPEVTSELSALQSLGEPTLLERAALAETADLDVKDRARILAMHRRIADTEPWALFGVAPETDRRTLKLAYFRMSKEFHPDRFYGKRLGSFATRLSEIFEALARGYADLTEAPTIRGSRAPAADHSQPQTPAEYAAELFDRGCTQEVSGDTVGALKLFDAAIRVDGQVRYLRRAAECALTAHEDRAAENYAKKAAALEPLDASIQRLLARVFRAAGRLGDAEEVLLMAMQLKVDSDALVRELRADLAEVRRLLARP
ncbi:MAG: hypothetical protein K8W52_22500 [Deltaproteobacteria bacterium]|nr:hypothetical protein [Deltaproteobacteria bacterium]